MSKPRKTSAICLGFIAVMLFIMFSSISYFSDDWLWGSYKSLRTFLGSFSNETNPWHDYPNNGRYLGNFLGFIGSNYFILRNLIMTVVMCTIIIELGSICNMVTDFVPDPGYLFLLAVLFLLCPRSYFGQTVAWNSSFMNYIVPSALFLILIRKTFMQNENAGGNILFLILPLLTALFMENLTIGSVLFISLRILLHILRKETPKINEWLWLLGAALGMFLMFSDDGYRQVFENTPNNSVWHAQTGSLLAMIQTAVRTFQNQFVFCFFRGNALINCWGALNMFFVCLSVNPAVKKNGVILRLLGLTELLIGCYFAIRYFEPSWKVFMDHTLIFESMAALIFVLIIPVIGLFLPWSGMQKERLFLSWLFVVCITVPLLEAEPLTVRVFFPTFIFSLLDYCYFAWINNSSFSKRFGLGTLSGLRLGLIGLFLLSWGFRTSIYAVESHYEKERVKFIRYQESIGASPVLLPRMPYADYIIVSWPDGDLWQERYKRFYNLNLDLKYELISFDEWTKFAGKL